MHIFEYLAIWYFVGVLYTLNFEIQSVMSYFIIKLQADTPPNQLFAVTYIFPFLWPLVAIPRLIFDLIDVIKPSKTDSTPADKE